MTICNRVDEFSIFRHHLVFDGTENSCITYLLQHYKTITDLSQNPKNLYNHIRSYTTSTSFDVIDCHIDYRQHNPINHSYDNNTIIIQCKATIHEIVSNFDPKIVIMDKPIISQAIKYTDDQLCSLCNNCFIFVIFL